MSRADGDGARGGSTSGGSASGDSSSTPATSGGGIPAITGTLDHLRAIHVFAPALQPWRATVLAYGALFVATTMGFPMDTVKTRMQTHRNFAGYGDCVRQTFAREGVRGFFRGIWAPLVLTLLSKSLSVLLFTQTKPHVYRALYGDAEAAAHPLLMNAPVCFVSGALAGGGVLVFACPFEFTKVYAQIALLVQHKLMHLHGATAQPWRPIFTWGTFCQIVRYEGVRGLYSGYRYHLLRDAILLGVYYLIYELLKWLLNAVLDHAGSSQLSILLAGGLLGVLCWTVVFPLDTTKLLIQKDVVTNILRKERGLRPHPPRARTRMDRALYRGLGISLTRSFIVNMVFFSVYEFAMAHVA